MRRLLLISTSTTYGTGYLDHAAEEIRDFLGSVRSVLFVPYALHDRDAYAEKARERFGAMGLTLHSIHRTEDPVAAVRDAESVFIGGGNTFRLLDTLCALDLIEPLRRRVLDGMPYVGTSAGSNVATLSIRNTNDMPIVYPPTFDALRLIPFNLNPHFVDADPSSKHMGETRETRIREFHEENDAPVVGLREGAWLRVEWPEITLGGTSGAKLFEKGRDAIELAPGASLAHLLE
ncbi:MAG: dipeptidase PepE [Thermoanaerobaculia bacterium]